MENKKENNVKKIYYALFLLSAAVLMGWIILASDITETGMEGIRSFSDNWSIRGGAAERVDLIKPKWFDGVVMMEKRLPGNLREDDCICFESRNAEFMVWVDDRLIADYVPAENISGRGLGNEFHCYGLKKSDGGKMLKIKFSGVIEGYGRIMDAYICSAPEYIHHNVEKRILPALVSAIIFSLGVMMIILYMRILDKESMPFDIFSLGVVSVVMGVWLFTDTNIMSIITGQNGFWRAVSRTLVFFPFYPFVCFVNSITKTKRKTYEYAAFWGNILIFAIYLGMKIFGGVDMIQSFSVMIAVGVAFLILMIAIILMDDRIYCRANKMNPVLKEYYAGMLIFMAGWALDVLTYMVFRGKNDTSGAFTRLGMVFFILYCLFIFTGRWTKDRAVMERDRFVNRAMQYAFSSGSPDDSIKAMLSFMGSELKAGRIGIFEEHENGKYHGTYEWFRDGMVSAGLDLIFVPYEGFVDQLKKGFGANDRCLIIEDPEKFKELYPNLYSLLKSHNVTNMIAGELESNGEILGVLTVFNAPSEHLQEISEIIRLSSYFMSQMIKKREEQERLRYYSYNDQLSGALNRRAYKEYMDETLDQTLPFGYIVCNIDNLGAANASGGYDAGDRMVKNMVGIMKEIFGDTNVYRLSGAEFAAFGFETDETFFNGDVQRVRNGAKEKGIDISVGAVYCANGTMGMSRVINRANKLMKEEQKS